MKEISNKPVGVGRFFLVFLFRLLLLVVGGGFAALLGVALAIVYPATTPNKPLVAEVIELIPGVDKTPSSNDLTKSAVSNSTTQTVDSEPANPPAKLTKAQRRRLEVELRRLERQLKTVSDRTAAIETKLGNGGDSSTEALEERVRSIKQQLGETDSIVSTSQPLISTETLTAVLPADSLFEDNQAVMRPEANRILNQLSRELQNYPGAKVRIGVHTDGVGETKENQVLSFRQGQLLEQYFSKALGNSYRWLVVGYGETNPLFPNEGTANLQRNRRVEITVEPK